jgi:hypothetical protein
MEGMGLNRKDEGYGRLDDDWDDHEVGPSFTSRLNLEDGEMGRWKKEMERWNMC